MKRVKHFYILVATAIFIITGMVGVLGLGLWVDSNADCQKLNEKLCQARSDCAAVYDNDFKKCVALSAQAQVKLSQGYNLCKRTRGEWKKTKFGEYCDCAVIYPPMVFAPGKGCVVK